MSFTSQSSDTERGEAVQHNLLRGLAREKPGENYLPEHVDQAWNQSRPDWAERNRPADFAQAFPSL